MSAEDKLSIYDIKLEIARRIERISVFDPRDYDSDAILHNRGVVKGLDALWKWIQNSEGGDRG